MASDHLHIAAGDPFGGLTVADLDMDVIGTAKAISFSCGALRSEQSYEAVKAASAACKGLVCCDPGGFPDAWGDRKEISHRIRLVAGDCDVFKCSAEEAKAYFDIATPARQSFTYTKWDAASLS